jgi:hypothetical protein
LIQAQASQCFSHTFTSAFIMDPSTEDIEHPKDAAIRALKTNETIESAVESFLPQRRLQPRRNAAIKRRTALSPEPQLTMTKPSSQPIVNNPPLQTRIQVYWPKDDEWYTCVITKKWDNGRVKLVYEDGDVENVRLEKEKWRLADANEDSQVSLLRLRPPT